MPTGGIPCKPNCKCKKHSVRIPKCKLGCTCGKHFIKRNKCKPECTCGRHIGHNKGIPLSEETKKKISLANKGRKRTPEQIEKSRIGLINSPKHPWRGKKLSAEHRAKMSKTRTGKKIKTTERGREIRRKLIAEARKKSRFFNTKPEMKLASLLDKEGIVYKRHQHFLNSKYNVDFVLENGTLIEVYGRYWHSKPEQIKYDRKKEHELRKAGNELLIIWDDEDYDKFMQTMRVSEYERER